MASVVSTAKSAEPCNVLDSLVLQQPNKAVPNKDYHTIGCEDYSSSFFVSLAPYWRHTS